MELSNEEANGRKAMRAWNSVQLGMQDYNAVQWGLVCDVSMQVSLMSSTSFWNWQENDDYR